MAWPMPEVEPVTRAVVPDRSIFMEKFLMRGSRMDAA